VTVASCHDTEVTCFVNASDLLRPEGQNSNRSSLSIHGARAASAVPQLLEVFCESSKGCRLVGIRRDRGTGLGGQRSTRGHGAGDTGIHIPTGTEPRAPRQPKSPAVSPRPRNLRCYSAEKPLEMSNACPPLQTNRQTNTASSQFLLLSRSG
jgi:hypothetical protein